MRQKSLRKDKTMMKAYIKIFIFGILLVSIPLSGMGSGKALAIREGEIHTISRGVIQDGTILIAEGRITAVGSNISVPQDAKIIHARGLIVTPGIIDARSSYGLRFVRNRKDYLENYMNPARRVLEDYTHFEDTDWLRCGVTTVYLTPSAGNLLGGFGAVVKLVGTKKEAVVKDLAGMSVSFGEYALKGEKIPTTRQGRIGRLRQEFIRALEYKDRKKKGTDQIEINPQYEAILKMLDREIPARVYANSPDDIMTALRLAKEFNLRLVIDSGAGAHKVAHALAEAKIPVVVGPSIMGLGGGGPLEMSAHTPFNAGRLYNAGILVTLCTDGRGGRSVLSEGVIAKSHGLRLEAALRSLTLDAAKILEVDDRLGSIEVGKDADIVVWKNHPLGTWGKAQVIIVNGLVVFDRSEE